MWSEFETYTWPPCTASGHPKPNSEPRAQPEPNGYLNRTDQKPFAHKISFILTLLAFFFFFFKLKSINGFVETSYALFGSRDFVIQFLFWSEGIAGWRRRKFLESPSVPWWSQQMVRENAVSHWGYSGYFPFPFSNQLTIFPKWVFFPYYYYCDLAMNCAIRLLHSFTAPLAALNLTVQKYFLNCWVFLDADLWFSRWTVRLSMR